MYISTIQNLQLERCCCLSAIPASASADADADADSIRSALAGWLGERAAAGAGIGFMQIKQVYCQNNSQPLWIVAIAATTAATALRYIIFAFNYLFAFIYYNLSIYIGCFPVQFLFSVSKYCKHVSVHFCGAFSFGAPTRVSQSSS